jgi:hypothetical protein
LPCEMGAEKSGETTNLQNFTKKKKNFVILT